MTKIKKGFIKKKERVKSSFIFTTMPSFKQVESNCSKWSRKLKTQGLPESWWRIISKLVNLCLVKTFSLISTPALGAFSVNFLHAKYWTIFVLLCPFVATYSSDLEQKKHLISSVELAVKWLLNRLFCLPSTLFHLVGPNPEYWGSVQSQQKRALFTTKRT